MSKEPYYQRNCEELGEAHSTEIIEVYIDEDAKPYAQTEVAFLVCYPAKAKVLCDKCGQVDLIDHIHSELKEPEKNE